MRPGRSLSSPEGVSIWYNSTTSQPQEGREMWKQCSAPGCTFLEFHNFAHSFELDLTRRCVPCVQDEVRVEVRSESKRLIEEEEDEAAISNSLVQSWTAVDVFKCTACDFSTKFKAWATRHASQNVGHDFVGIEQPVVSGISSLAEQPAPLGISPKTVEQPVGSKRCSRPEQEKELLFKKPRGRVPKGKEWDQLNGNWVEVRSESKRLIEEEEDEAAISNSLVVSWAVEECGPYAIGTRIETKVRRGTLQQRADCLGDYGWVVKWDDGKSTIEWLRGRGKLVHNIVTDESSAGEGEGEGEANCLNEAESLEGVEGEKGCASIGEYTSVSKKSHRFTFAAYCEDAAARAEARSADILYLESADGDATVELLKHFNPSQLHPCNHDEAVTKILKSKFPGVFVEFGDIYDIYSKKLWLGVWFDTEETWKYSNGSEWNADKIPVFHQAHVIAVTLNTRHCVNKISSSDLDRLLVKNGCRVQEHSRGYIGKSGKMNMTFGIATFEEPYMRVPAPLPADFMFSHLRVPVEEMGDFEGKKDYNIVNGCFVATVTRAVKDGLYITFQSKNLGLFFSAPDDDKYSIDQIERWRVM